MTASTNPKDALGVRKAALRLVPPALALVASDAMADGAAKYGPFNWRESSVRLTVYLEAIERHLLALKDGQNCAEDSGHLHIGHIAACCAIIADAGYIGMLIDDRPKVPGPAADMLRDRDKTANPTATHEVDPELVAEMFGVPIDLVAPPAKIPAGEPCPDCGDTFPYPFERCDLHREQPELPAPEDKLPIYDGRAARGGDIEVGDRIRTLKGLTACPGGLLGTVTSIAPEGVWIDTPGVSNPYTDSGRWCVPPSSLEVIA